MLWGSFADEMSFWDGLVGLARMDLQEGPIRVGGFRGAMVLEL